MDAGCEYHGYASDITRTWPVNGKFTEVQRRLYDAVHQVQTAAIKVGTQPYMRVFDYLLVDVDQLVRPGVTLNEVHNMTEMLLAAELESEFRIVAFILCC